MSDFTAHAKHRFIMSHVVIFAAKAGVSDNNVMAFESEDDAREFAEHLISVNKKYLVMVCQVISYHVSG